MSIGREVLYVGRIIHINDNGEITKEYSDKSNRIISDKQIDYLKLNTKSKGEFESFNEEAGKFIWSYPAKIQELIKSSEFTKSDLTMIFYLATYVNGHGFLVYDNQIKLDKNDLQKVLGIGRNLFSMVYNKLKNHKILIPSGYAFKWNESYNFYGKTTGVAKPTMLVRTYVNQIRELYEATTETGERKYSAVSLYPIFALVPYLHRTTNIICKNPEVTAIEDIDYLTLSEVAELLDLKDSKKMSASLTSIHLAEQSVFRKVEVRNEKYLQMNPRIFWKDVTAPDERLIAEFDMVDNRLKRKNNQKLFIN
ncbi:hypothetical protein BABA_13130 [Neobacillus bataviensis LMG 21833]|uniref:DM10 domain-containing protein n=1 Tax=Neobacillus bataviensis LMG 21833 TaxID=1117379 RepID=K6DFJ6_9BACI|nr:hypothetical protein [Neobacillus bataviensis]EKN67069.1 hypothetical protein BABA_13130 [Neobacillus bataviensis LMG 21833]